MNADDVMVGDPNEMKAIEQHECKHETIWLTRKETNSHKFFKDRGSVYRSTCRDEVMNAEDIEFICENCNKKIDPSDVEYEW